MNQFLKASATFLFAFLFVVAMWELTVFDSHAQELRPFDMLSNEAPDDGEEVGENEVILRGFSSTGDRNVRFQDLDIDSGWLPWIIKNLSILVGGISFLVFSYAGLNLFIRGDDPEQITNSLKMITYAIVGLVIAALSYTIVANVLNLF